MAPKDIGPQNSPREVTRLLHTLRDEQFRHMRNIQKTRPKPPSFYMHDNSKPSLPIDLIHPPITQGHSGQNEFPIFRTAGPTPPRSWTVRSQKDRIDYDTPAWRSHALSMVLSSAATRTRTVGDGSDKSPIPSLTLCCLSILRAYYTDDDFSQVVPFIPPHLRRNLLNHTAVHSPLSQIELRALCSDNGHVDGELIVVGPQASLRKDHFLRSHDVSMSDTVDVEHEEWSWDAPMLQSDDPPLHTLALLSTSLPLSTYLALPPTISCLALVNITSALPLHRLHIICPLLVVLDLSYNKWLNSRSQKVGNTTILEDVEWSKLHYLRYLGLRECQVAPKMLAVLNKGRWDDVVVIQ